MKKIIEKWALFSKEQKIITVVSAVLAFTLVIGGGILISAVIRDAGASGTESTQGTESYGIETFGTEATEVTEVTEMEVIETMTVTMTATSFEKDLKIKILDENKSLIAGQNFVIIVTPEGSDTGKEYNDHDMDGIIYIKSIAPGKYTVQLQEIEGFVPVENPITATVKEQIVYEKVDISNEIKDESEVNEVEKAPDNGESTKNEIKDTLPYLKSSVVTDEVTKDRVDMSVFSDAKVSTNKSSIFTRKTIGTDGTEQDAVTAEVSFPESATLYTTGKESSKTVTLQLNLKDDAGIIKDIQWQIDGVAPGSSGVVDCVVAADEMSAVLTVKSAGTAEVSVVVTYVESITTQEDTDSSEEGSEGDGNDNSETDSASYQVRSSVNTNINTTNQQTQEQTNTGKVTCAVTVGAQTDDTTQLKDVVGNLLYLDADATKPATPKSYETAEKFYANPKYTGWQTFGEKSYYYKEDHTYVTGKQVIGGVEFEFDETGYLITKERSIGIDVSKWQEEIDWEAVANAPVDIEFAIIRCGNRYGASGVIAEDKYFKQNIEGAIKNGIKVGVYFFSQAITKAEAVEEASAALELVKGYNLQLPIYIDTESLEGGRANSLSKEERTEILVTFCEVIKNAGYKPGVYSGKWWFMNKVNVSELEQYHIWVAQYSDECTYPGRYDIWQYTSSGAVPGINGKVDMNIAYRVYY